MNKVSKLALVVVLLAFTASAQEIRHEITVQGSGYFPKESTDAGLTTKPTYSGGVMAGFRYHVNRWIAVEGDYDYFRNSENFLTTSAATRIPMNVHAVTGSAIVKLPSFGALPAHRKLSPFVLAGGGVMDFDPRDTSAVSSQTRGTFVYGGGADVPLLKRVAVRAQYRGFVYKVPDFDTSTLRVDKYTHAAVPSAGLVLTF